MNVVTASFTSVPKAEEAVRALRDAGFRNDQIGVYTRDEGKARTLASDLGREWRGADVPADMVTNDRYIGGVLPDGYVDLIRHSNLPDEAVDWYGGQLRGGSVLVVADTTEALRDADCVMTDHGGTLYPHSPGRECRPKAATTDTRTDVQEMRLPVVDEQVTLEKMSHQVGEVVIHRERVVQDVDVPATVTHEEIVVERRTLDRPMHPSEYKGMAMEEGTYRMPIVEEEIRVTKAPVIREELVVRRRPITEQKTFHEQVTHDEPRVETTGDVPIRREGEGKRRPAA